MRPSLALRPRNASQALSSHFRFLCPKPCCLQVCKHALAYISTLHMHKPISLHTVENMMNPFPNIIENFEVSVVISGMTLLQTWRRPACADPAGSS